MPFGSGFGFMVSSASTASSAAALLAAYGGEGLAVDFTDMSMKIVDSGTPSNNFSGDPNDKLTYSSPGTKWVLGSNGLYSSGSTLRTQYNTSEVATGTQFERSKTNVVLWNRDLTNAAWTKSNVTAAKDQTGIDGVSNSASSITATSANGTCLQAITLASSARFQTAFVKRITGSGTINMTMDNGTTWTAITVTASWTRVSIPTQTLANPTVGFRIVTSGDAIAVDFVQNEDGAYASSPIATTTASVTRAQDFCYIPVGSFPNSLTDGTLFVEAISVGSEGGVVELATYSNDTTSNAVLLQPLLGTTGRVLILTGGVLQSNMSLSGLSAPGSGSANKVASAWSNNDAAAVANGGTVDVDASVSIPNAAATIISFHAAGSGAANSNSILKSLLYVPTRLTNAQLQGITTL